MLSPVLRRHAHHDPVPHAMPQLSDGEWRDVQAALRAVAGHGCAEYRGLRRFLRPRLPNAVASELEPLRDFLCESARHGPAVGELAERLERQGFSPAQIAALSFIAG
jgi:hypothetical protein